MTKTRLAFLRAACFNRCAMTAVVFPEPTGLSQAVNLPVVFASRQVKYISRRSRLRMSLLPSVNTYWSSAARRSLVAVHPFEPHLDAGESVLGAYDQPDLLHRDAHHEI